MSETTTQPDYTDSTMIDMKFYAVQPFLQRFISAFVIMRASCDKPIVSIFTAKTESILMFNIGACSERTTATYDFPNTPNKHFTFYSHEAWLGGMLTEPNIGTLASKCCTLCVVLTPFGMHHLLRDNSTNMLNRGLALSNLSLPVYFSELIEKLQATENETVAVRMVEANLLRYFSQLNIPFSVKDMSPVVGHITRNKGKIKVKDLEDKFHISRRWIEKQFLAQIGVSPKEFARVTRFIQLLKEATVTPSVSWSNLIEDYGYYDQSHLIRDFHDFTGKAPVEYLQSLNHHVDKMFYQTLDS